MRVQEALLVALRALRAGRLRSTLAMLGLIIGIAAVILLFALGRGVQKSVNARIAPIITQVTVVSQHANVGGGPAMRPLTDADAAALREEPAIASVTPVVTGTAQVATNTTTFLSATIIGSTQGWLKATNRDIQAGSFLDQAQVSEGEKVGVLGPSVAITLFGDPGAALDQTVRIANQRFRVIGVMQSFGQQEDSTVIMPLSTARRYIVGRGAYTGVNNGLSQILVNATQETAVAAAMNQVTQTLDTRHHIQNPQLRDFQIQSQGNRLQSFRQIIRIVTVFTPAVAAISLVVGGLGIMNIMLVSVTERTREIGIRRAVGATRRAILEQFLIESTVLASLGGLVGIVVGIGLSILAGTIAPALTPSRGAFADFSPVLNVLPVMVSFTTSVAIGLIAGCYPAYRAAKLVPIEALRYQ